MLQTEDMFRDDDTARGDGPSSLLEGLVFSRRIGEAVYRRMEECGGGAPLPEGEFVFERKGSRITARLLRGPIQQMMQDNMGFRRSREGLKPMLSCIICWMRPVSYTPLTLPTIYNV